MAEQVKDYLDYLDKEMSIMGILSTFCVAAVALVLDRIGNADLTKESLFRWLWLHQAPYILVGSGWLIVAGLCFYLQRSLLAFYYGGISLSVTDSPRPAATTADWLTEADSWGTWLRYRAGFMCLVLAFLSYSLALIAATHPSRTLPVWWLWIAPALIGLEQIPHCAILYRFRYEARPFQCFFAHLRGGKVRAASR